MAQSIVGVTGSRGDRHTLLKRDSNGVYQQIKTSDLDGKPFAVYCSAKWCPPCQAFTPVLAKLYQECNENGKPFEVVFCSMDKNEEQFMDYFKKMPWAAIPLGDSVNCSKFGVNSYQFGSIPSLILYDENGKVVTNDAVSFVRSGEMNVGNYPWKSLQGRKGGWCSIM